MRDSMKSKIQVRSKEGIVIDTIKRKLRFEQIGNFNLVFCTYKKDRRCIVESDAGDLSDPFRRDSTYTESFHIIV